MGSRVVIVKFQFARPFHSRPWRYTNLLTYLYSDTGQTQGRTDGKTTAINA